jgi:hypothetical protein
MICKMKSAPAPDSLHCSPPILPPRDFGLGARQLLGPLKSVITTLQ